MNERLARLAANQQQPTKPDSEGGNNDAAPRTIGHDAGNSADRDDDHPNRYHTGFIHGPDGSTAKALPHVITALVAKRAEIAGQIAFAEDSSLLDVSPMSWAGDHFSTHFVIAELRHACRFTRESRFGEPAHSADDWQWTLSAGADIQQQYS